MRHHIAYIAVAAVMASGCDGFLERTSQNQIVPTTVEHYKEMLQGTDGYFYNAPSRYSFVGLMTDDISYTDATRMATVPNPVESSNLLTYRLPYQWADEIESDDFIDTAFDYLYSQVLVGNTVLEAIDRLTDEYGEREALRGQALFHRAFAYFMLANLYAPAYNESGADTPCVPLKLEPTPSTGTFDRASMQKVWGQIRKDIDTGLANLEGYRTSNIYELNRNAMLVLAVRVSLQMEDFDAVTRYGEELLKTNGKLFDISGKTQAISDKATYLGGSDLMNFISPDNPEIVWLYGSRSGGLPQILGGLAENHMYYYAFSDDLIASYGKDIKEGQEDRRLKYFFLQPHRLQAIASQNFSHTILKYDYEDGYARSQAFRTGEVYISLAEAYARKSEPDYDKALSYLNELRRHRVHGHTALSLEDVGGEAGITEFIWRERRRELCGEELHRWWDLRRTGQPSIVHPWKDNQKYVLQEKDKAYILNFPQTERESNPQNYNERPLRPAQQ